MTSERSADTVAMSDDDPYFGKIYDEDGYCVACGSGKWKHHMPQCQVADLIDAIREAITVIERERLSEGSLDEEERILGILRAALIDGTVSG